MPRETPPHHTPHPRFGRSRTPPTAEHGRVADYTRLAHHHRRRKYVAGYSGDDGPATAAELDYPHGVAVDAAGNLFIADYDNNCVREVNIATGVITTVAGNGTAGYSGDGGPATAAELQQPRRRSPSTPRATCSSPTASTT